MSAKKSNGSAKKAGSANAEPENYDTRDVVLGHVRGFPPWPGMVVDPTALPKAVAKERPASKKSGVYAVRFFPAGDYAWLPARELSRLTPSAINAFISGSDSGSKNAAGGRKNGDLMEGYRKALDPDAWEAEHEANPPAAKGARKSKSKSKGRKKSEDDDEEDEEEAEGDELGEEDAEDDSEKPAGKKRKRASSPVPKAKKAPAKAKAAPASKTKAGKGKKTKKSKAAVESEDDGDGDADEDGGDAEGEGEEDTEGGGRGRASKKSKTGGEDVNAKMESDPEALKVREWRHKLQKTFLSSNKALPKEEEMPAVDTLFTTVESYEGMNIGYLTFSKIGKVMRHIHLLEPGKVPRDDEFKFRDRAKALVDRWHGILNSNSTGAPKENGHAKAAGEEGAEGEAAESTAMDVSGAGEGEGEGDLTAMDMTMDETA